MKFYRFGVFTSELPNDAIEDDYDIIQFPGQGIARVIAQILRDDGYDVEEPEHLEHLGWEFNVTKGHILALRVSDIGPFVILTSMPGPYRRAPLDPQRFNDAVLRTVISGLTRDGRFHDILWFDEIGDEYGFTDPVVGAPGSERRKPPAAWGWA
jgi:hypothetical protein